MKDESSPDIGINEQSQPGESNDETLSRRNLLKTAGAVGAGLVFTAGQAAAETHVDTPATSFDPANTTDVQQFIIESFEASKNLNDAQTLKGRQKIKNELSKSQMQAVRNALTDATLSVEVVEETGTEPQPVDQEGQRISTQAIQDCTEFSRTVNAYFNVFGTKHLAFKYTHTINWCFNSSSYTVFEPKSSGFGDGYNYFLVVWEYQRDVSVNINIAANKTHFTSDRTGLFERCTFGNGFTCVGKDQVFTRLLGDGTGHGILLKMNVTD